MEPLFIDDKTLSGSHLPFGGRFSDAIRQGIQHGMYAIQVYMGNQQSYARSRISDADITETQKLLQQYPTHLFTHSPVIYNLAGSVKLKSLAWSGNTQVDSQMEGLLKNLNYELEILGRVGARGTIIHPGYYITPDKQQECIQAIAKTLDRAVIPPGVKIFLENSAGEKGKIAYTLEQLIAIRDLTVNKDQIGFCIDTAHTFGSGLYDLRKVSEISRMFSDFDKIPGLVGLIHLNDSAAPFNSKKDRHALLHTGEIWKADNTSLQYLIHCATERKIPLILETSPSDIYTLHGLTCCE